MKKILFLLSLISIDQFTKYLVLKNFLIGESLMKNNLNLLAKNFELLKKNIAINKLIII